MIKVKICGIHSVKEAKDAVKSGADYLGLLVNMPHTNLSHSVESACTIVSSFKKARFIVLTMEEDNKKLLKILKRIDPWGVQLLRPAKSIVEYLQSNTNIKIIPVVHVSGSGILKKARGFYNADFILLDSKSKGKLGGTGKTHNWKISKKIIQESPIPVFLAGGLNQLNVRLAIERTTPYAVDAESSLRNKLGFRDDEKVKLFIEQTKSTS